MPPDKTKAAAAVKPANRSQLTVVDAQKRSAASKEMGPKARRSRESLKRLERYGEPQDLSALAGKHSVLERHVGDDAKDDYKIMMEAFQAWMLAMRSVAQTMALLCLAFFD